MTPRERTSAVLSAWQRAGRYNNNDIDALFGILEAEFARMPEPGTVSAIMSETRRRGWESMPAADRRQRMRWVARHPRPSRRRRSAAG
jgi:hypothetical protein